LHVQAGDKILFLIDIALPLRVHDVHTTARGRLVINGTGGINALVLYFDRVSGEGLACILREIQGISAVFSCGDVDRCADVLRRAPVKLAVVEDQALDVWAALPDARVPDRTAMQLIVICDPSRPLCNLSLNGHKPHVVERGPGARNALADTVTRLMESTIPRTNHDLNGHAERELGKLTHAEQSVLTLLAQGLSTKEIASTLFVSPRTVETHRAQITSKLSIRSIAGLTKFAIRAGIASLEG
jgi:DNA-binding CsgD family transcriptional regulator